MCKGFFLGFRFFFVFVVSREMENLMISFILLFFFVDEDGFKESNDLVIIGLNYLEVLYSSGVILFINNLEFVEDFF